MYCTCDPCLFLCSFGYTYVEPHITSELVLSEQWVELNYRVFSIIMAFSLHWKSNFLMASSHIWDECMTSLKIRLVIKTWAYQCFSFHILLLFYTLFMSIKQISWSYICQSQKILQVSWHVALSYGQSITT